MKMRGLIAALVIALAAVVMVTATGPAHSRVDRVAASMPFAPTADACEPMTMLVDVDDALDHPGYEVDGNLTPARGCKGCFG
mmetsp:Transcript_25059/g.64715  ORF Transcript_25059/g.64715 Transcript_25059/m.64715 type:complete len:82 (+) Transcript_25059:104-349(+)